MGSPRLLQNLLLGFLALLLVLGLLWAATAGSRAGKSVIILKNTSAVREGLQYFLADQNRYPTAIEFQDRNIMANYFSAFPPQPAPGGPCPNTYDYSSPTAQTFQLHVCLPKAAAGFAAGWNKFIQP